MIFPTSEARPAQAAAQRWFRAWVVATLMLVGAAPALADTCGQLDGRPCRIDERIPSCDVNLVEAAGRCIRPACGAAGEHACSEIERPLHAGCDMDLVMDLGRRVCAHPSCGRLNERPCTVVERIPSCDHDLVEGGGRCLRPACGRLNERACQLTERAMKPCDTNLMLRRDNVCVMPGSGGAPAGQTVPQVHGSAPVPPPSAQIPPPTAHNPASPLPSTPNSGYLPPPASNHGTGYIPPPASTTTHGSMPIPTIPAPTPAQHAGTGTVGPNAGNAGNLPSHPATGAPGRNGDAGAGQAQGGNGIDFDTDRVGNDYLTLSLAVADPAQCQQICRMESQCTAWSYAKPGTQSRDARCHLKRPAPAPTPNACCASGVR